MQQVRTVGMIQKYIHVFNYNEPYTHCKTVRLKKEERNLDLLNSLYKAVYEKLINLLGKHEESNVFESNISFICKGIKPQPASEISN